MAIEYRLTLAGDVSGDRLAQLAFPDPAERPTPSVSAQMLDADLYEQRGYWVGIAPRRGGYYEADGDGGDVWEWELDTSVDVTFSMGKDDLTDQGIPNMLTVVARILEGTTEDAALTQNDLLLLTRINHVRRKYNRQRWWDHYGFPNSIVLE